LGSRGFGQQAAMRRTLPLLLAPLLLVAGGCNDKPLPTREPKPKTATLISQDFDNPKTDEWIKAAGGTIKGGELVMTAGPGEVARSGAAKDRIREDVHVSVQAFSDDIVGDDATYGVLCRWTFDAQNQTRDYYAFTIAPNGFAAIGTSRNFLWQSIQPIKAIRQGRGEVNEIRAECVGPRLSLYVNDELVKTVQNRKLPSGDVGVTLENYGTRRRATARFDDFLAEQVL
jgi:hypothetical protein